MKYKDAFAFRRALEMRLRHQSIEAGIPLLRLRKMVAFERFLARLAMSQPDQWVLKGGLALQWRLGVRARTTQDVDLHLFRSDKSLHTLLVQGAALDLQDGFAFEVQASKQHPNRFTVHCLLAGRLFESFHVDVGTEDVLSMPPEKLTPPALLAFAEIDPMPIWVYPLTQQIAEKVHAYTYPHRIKSRVKDWVDLALLGTLGPIHSDDLRRALETTFAHRNTHPLPARLPSPPVSWWASSRRMRRECGLTYASLDAMHRAIGGFLDPVLEGNVPDHCWHVEQWTWLPTRGDNVQCEKE